MANLFLPEHYNVVLNRIDGAIVDVAAHIGKKMILNNGSVVMDIQGASSNESDEIAVLLVSLQFDSGL